MNKTKKLLKNAFIFGLGSLGSKVISFLIVPLYTFYLTVKEYGEVDLYVTVLNLLLPVISFCIYDAVLRFLLDKKNAKEKVISSALVLITIASFILLLIVYFVDKFFFHTNFLCLVSLLLVLQIYQVTLSQYLKGIGKNLLYSMNGIAQSLLVLGSSFFFLSSYENKLYAYFLAQVVAFLLGNILLIISSKVYRQVAFTKIDKKLIKMMLLYSLPLIPNQLMWWVMNASDRFFISYFLGFSINGLYAVSSKIPALLNIVSTVFTQSWQLSAIEEKNSDDKNDFYSSVFNHMSASLLICISFIFIVLKTFIRFFVGNYYYQAWQYVPLLLISLLFSTFSMFVGMVYLVSMHTFGIFKTSVYGAIINTLLNILLIPYFGANGASFATLVSFLIIWLIRMKETKEHVIIKVDWKVLGTSLMFIILQICTLYNSYFASFNILFFVGVTYATYPYWEAWGVALLNKMRHKLR